LKNPISSFVAWAFSKQIKSQAMDKTNEFIQVATKVLKSKVSAYHRGDGYSSGRAGGSGSKFVKGLSASGRSILLRHYEIRQNARDAIQDSPQAKMIVDRFGDTVVDTGLKVKPAPKFKILGITPEQAEEWAEDVAERFDSWASSKKSDRSEVNTFYQNQRSYHIFQQRDNDMFVRFFYNSSKKLANPLQIKFIDPNQIRGHGYTSTYAQYKYDDGIIRDAADREIGYKIWEYNNDGVYKEHTIPAKGKRSGRTLMIHGYNPEYANQGRGYSRLSHILQEIENLTDFTVSHIMKAIQQTVFTMYVKPSDKHPASNPLEGRVGPRAEGVYNTTDQDNEVTAEDEDPIVKFSNMPEATFDVPGSVGVFNLQEGEDLKPFEHSAPVDKYDTFVDAFFKHLSASMSMPAEVALMRFEQNYSASRGALTLFWDVVKIWRKEMESDFLDPVYESWLSEEIAAGRIQAPGWSDPVMRQAWLNAWWAGKPMPNIDPMKTAKADQLYVEMGAQTLDDVAENFNGSSGKANRAKITREFEELPESPFAKKGTPGNPGATGKLSSDDIEAIADEIITRGE
jgi:lambda family phage portal protein